MRKKELIDLLKDNSRIVYVRKDGLTGTYKVCEFISGIHTDTVLGEITPKVFESLNLTKITDVMGDIGYDTRLMNYFM